MLGRRTRARRPATGRTRVGARIAVVSGLLLVLLALAAPSAAANYARVAASAGCDRVVTWQASASTEGTDADRTNLRVLVQFRADRTEPWTDAGPEGSFTPSNGFAFSGSFPLPDGVDAVEVKVEPLARWGPDADDAEPGGPRFATAEVPEACDRQPLTASQQVDCETGAVQVRARNLGDRPLTAEVVVDRVVARELPLSPGGEATLSVPVLAGRPTQVEVRSGDLVASSRTSGGDCPAEGPGAVVLERCGTELGRLVVSAGGGGEPVGVEVRVRGTTVDRSRAEPGRVVQRALEVPAQELPVEVLLDGQVAAAGLVGGCDGPVAGLLSCGTPGHGACDLSSTRPSAPPEPPAPPPPLNLERGGAELPRTGPAQRAIGLLLGGMLLLGGGASLAARDRRQPAPSVLDEALAPYRQRWWDDP